MSKCIRYAYMMEYCTGIEYTILKESLIKWRNAHNIMQWKEERLEKYTGLKCRKKYNKTSSIIFPGKEASRWLLFICYPFYHILNFLPKERYFCLLLKNQHKCVIIVEHSSNEVIYGIPLSLLFLFASQE